MFEPKSLILEKCVCPVLWWGAPRKVKFFILKKYTEWDPENACGVFCGLSSLVFLYSLINNEFLLLQSRTLELIKNVIVLKSQSGSEMEVGG